MAINVFPSSLTPNVSECRIISNTKVFVSPLTGYTQTESRAGARWVMRMTFNNLQGEDRATLQGYIAGLQGKVNRAEIKDHSYTGARGALGTTIEVNGADQTGTSLDVRITGGGGASISGFLLAGDRISFSNGTNKEYKMVTADFDLTSGTGTLEIYPGIHTSPANLAAIETTTPVGTYMLIDDPAWTNRPGYDGTSASPFSDVSLSFVEDIA